VRSAPNPAPASGKKRVYTVDVLKRVLLETIALTNSMVGAKDQVPGYREAVEALPNRDLLRWLPLEIRSFLERELDALEQGDSPRRQAGCVRHAVDVFQCGDCDVYECTSCGDAVEQSDVLVIKTKGHTCIYCRMSGKYWTDGKVRYLSPVWGLAP
jgi:hypothetical protein